MKYKIFNTDCIPGSKLYLKDESVDLMICDPPFGINESEFDGHYNREESNVLDGYVEAPEDYYTFTFQWVSEAKRVLKPNGSMYVISGWTNLLDVLNVLKELDLNIVNHLIWKFNFGVFTKNKFVSSHYHILYLTKGKKSNPVFNTFCRFSSDEKDFFNGSLNYQDLEDVWVLNKEYHKGEMKNKNKLPDKLVEKMILYSSNKGDTICDFFMGNFTTAVVAIKLGRIPIGFELNTNSYNYYMDIIENLELGVVNYKKSDQLDLF